MQKISPFLKTELEKMGVRIEKDYVQTGYKWTYKSFSDTNYIDESNALMGFVEWLMKREGGDQDGK